MTQKFNLFYRLAKWVSDSSNHEMHNSTTADINFFLTIYGSLAAGNSVFCLTRAFLFAYGGICAAKTIHSKLLNAVVRGKVIIFLVCVLGLSLSLSLSLTACSSFS